MAVPDIEYRRIELRAPCEICKSTAGFFEVSGLQRPVYCFCGQYQRYNASRSETGEDRVSVRSRIEIPSSQRQRILERDGFRCVMCGRTPADGCTMQVDHLVTQADLARYGLQKPAEVNNDANLATTCDECNLGHGARSVMPVALLALSIAIAQKRARERKDGAA